MSFKDSAELIVAEESRRERAQRKKREAEEEQKRKEEALRKANEEAEKAKAAALQAKKAKEEARLAAEKEAKAAAEQEAIAQAEAEAVATAQAAAEAEEEAAKAEAVAAQSSTELQQSINNTKIVDQTVTDAESRLEKALEASPGKKQKRAEEAAEKRSNTGRTRKVLPYSRNCNYRTYDKELLERVWNEEYQKS